VSIVSWWQPEAGENICVKSNLTVCKVIFNCKSEKKLGQQDVLVSNCPLLRSSRTYTNVLHIHRRRLLIMITGTRAAYRGVENQGAQVAGH